MSASQMRFPRLLSLCKGSECWDAVWKKHWAAG